MSSYATALVGTDGSASSAGEALLETAKARTADLLVVGNRGLNGLAGRLLGSVPASLTHKASCDVLIVHTTGRGATP